ncbi:O-antigen ligase family protein [Phaeocystidibacter luteus]|uniref:O-antigen ligase family protein n=1 Tax=Phaeocystidibacter luteus TaxID=911197 RepID=A0A6N6RHP1_9FLAO|nr:O-antigen ligase family protein [Phaeocystidibacter luteus]KAB2810277.1 O-antigen ligase family protein [Phaeocystidibacter luteus]
MSKKLTNWLVYGGGVLFLLINVVAILTETYVLMAIPFALAAVAAAFLHLDKLMFFIVFATPLSVTLTDKSFNVGLSLPTEPLLAGITALLFFRFVQRGEVDLKVLRHPITVSILATIVWMIITTITSERPDVSIKYVIARIWFVVPFFYLLSQMFKKEQNIRTFYWLFLIPLCIAGLYTMYQHAGNGFSKESSVWVMYPLFKEHTSYGATLAMFFPISVYLVLRKSEVWVRAAAFFLFVVLTAAIVLSFTRAAWISIAGAGVVWLLIRYRVNFNALVIAALVGLTMLYGYREELFQKLEKNEQVSSDDIGEHVQSISNVSTDASNLERINRWTSAFRMWKERPHTGWGPGVYMFEYAPFQKPHEKTIISTNSGNRGNAHSEYIGPLAEQGWPGLVLVIVFVTLLMVYGIRAYRRAVSNEVAYLSICATLGLVTYFTHGFLNNFLDMDKAAGPVFAFTAVIVATDLFFRHPTGRKQR